jgi:hypothetical protein
MFSQQIEKMDFRFAYKVDFTWAARGPNRKINKYFNLNDKIIRTVHIVIVIFFFAENLFLLSLVASHLRKMNPITGGNALAGCLVGKPITRYDRAW